MVQHIVFWNVSYRGGQLAQNVSEQTKIDVHVDRFADILGTGPFEDQRDARRIDRCSKPRRALESAM